MLKSIFLRLLLSLSTELYHPQAHRGISIPTCISTVSIRTPHHITMQAKPLNKLVSLVRLTSCGNFGNAVITGEFFVGLLLIQGYAVSGECIGGVRGLFGVVLELDYASHMRFRTWES